MASTEAVLITVDDLAFDGPAGPVFRLGPFDVPRTGLTILHGPTGSGRSSALLALSGRLAGVRGSGRFDGLDLVGDVARVRRRSAVARITGLVDLEPRLSVEESITERALTEGVSPITAERAVRRVEALLGQPRLDRSALVETLSGRDRAVLTVALGCARPADLLVVDDVDAGLDDSDRAWFLGALSTVAATGVAVIGSAILVGGALPQTRLVPVSADPSLERSAPSPSSPPTPTAEEK